MGEGEDGWVRARVGECWDEDDGTGEPEGLGRQRTRSRFLVKFSVTARVWVSVRVTNDVHHGTLLFRCRFPVEPILRGRERVCVCVLWYVLLAVRACTHFCRGKQGRRTGVMDPKLKVVSHLRVAHTVVYLYIHTYIYRHLLIGLHAY